MADCIIVTNKNGTHRIREIKPRVLYSSAPRKESKFSRRRRKLRAQFDALMASHTITLHVPFRYQSDVKRLIRTAKHFFKKLGIPAWFVAQTYANQNEDNEDRWHVHGVISAPDIDIPELIVQAWCDFVFSEYHEHINFLPRTCETAREDMNAWFKYLMRQLEADSGKTPARLTASVLWPTQKKCKTQKEYLPASPALLDLCRQYKGKTVYSDTDNAFIDFCLVEREEDAREEDAVMTTDNPTDNENAGKATGTRDCEESSDISTSKLLSDLSGAVEVSRSEKNRKKTASTSSNLRLIRSFLLVLSSRNIAHAFFIVAKYVVNLLIVNTSMGERLTIGGVPPPWRPP